MGCGIIYFQLPFLGVRRYVLDPAGMGCSTFILLYWLYGTFALLFIIMIPHYHAGDLSIIPLIFHPIISFLTLFAFLNAMTSNPGLVQYPHTAYRALQHSFFKADANPPIPRDLYNPEAPNQLHPDWEFCQKCGIYRPKRAHHCSKCGHCVHKMDHHCPWINNCVGQNNQWLFMVLLFYATIQALFAISMDLMHLYIWNELPEHIRPHSSLAYKMNRVLCVSGLGLASSMALAMLGLLHSMHSNTMSDFTTLERMFAFEKLAGVNVMEDSGDKSQATAAGAAADQSGSVAEKRSAATAALRANANDPSLMGQVRNAMEAWNSANQQADKWRDSHNVSAWQSYRNTFGRSRPVYLWCCPLRFGHRDPAPEPQPAPDYWPPYVDRSLLSVYAVK